MFARSSVAKLPAAPGANGHPPNPPMQLSNFLIPSERAAQTLANAMALVS